MDPIKMESGRIYAPEYNTVQCYDDKEHNAIHIFTIRLPTEFEVEMLMEDLKGDD